MNLNVIDMNSSTLYVEKAKLIQSILNDIDDESVIEKLKSIVYKAVKYPARMSIDEMRKDVLEGVQQVENGEVISHEEWLKKHNLQ
jgi:ribosomal protein S8